MRLPKTLISQKLLLRVGLSHYLIEISYRLERMRVTECLVFDNIVEDGYIRLICCNEVYFALRCATCAQNRYIFQMSAMIISLSQAKLAHAPIVDATEV